MDLALDTQTGDLCLDCGDIATVSGVDAIRQSLSIRLRFLKGEWFMDPSIGVPYFERILVKNPNVQDAQAILRQVILTTPGVLGIERFEFNFDSVGRAARLKFTALSTEGPVVFDRELVVR